VTRLLLIGPPGAGKGTQAARLARAYSIPTISTGDIFRANVREQTALGREASAYMDAGDNVPDHLTNAMVRDRLAQPDASAGFLLDGYPRTGDQVRELDDFLASHGAALDAVIELAVAAEVVAERLRQRATEQGRSDDDEAVVNHRMQVYLHETAPLLGIYDQRGLLVRVDALGEMDDVTKRITTGLHGRGIALADVAAT